MKISLSDLPESIGVLIRDKRATVTYGAPAIRVSVATDGTDLILFPDRFYQHEALAKALGLKS